MRCRPQPPSLPFSGIAIVGEAPGEQEEQFGRPFIGTSGQELTRCLSDAGIARETCYLTNVFMDRPKDNNVELFFGKKLDAGKRFPPLRQGKYLLAQYEPELDRLRDELLSIAPTLVIALGNTAAWALLGSGAISKIRGTTALAKLVPYKTLATFHPSYILRQWSDRCILVADLIKARRESQSPEITRPHRSITIEPTLEDLTLWSDRLLNAEILSVDVETRGGQITCLGFAPSKHVALVVPLVDRRKPDNSYWSAIHETFVHRWLRLILESPVPKLFQNGLYDVQYIWRTLGIRVMNFQHDTMLRHHSVQPEMQKSLGFLGSLYTTEAPWKLMRETADTVKRDE